MSAEQEKPRRKSDSSTLKSTFRTTERETDSREGLKGAAKRPLDGVRV
jgi:hypothetical protein